MKIDTNPIGAADLEAIRQCVAAAPGVALAGFDRAGRITLFDAGAERLFGYRAENVIGAVNYELLHEPENFARFFEPDAFSGRGSVELEIEAQTRERERVPVSATLHRVAGDGNTWLIALYRDLSPLHQARQPLKENRLPPRGEKSQSAKEEEFLRGVLANTMRTIQIGLVVQERTSGVVAYVNDGFSSITGIEERDILGNTIAEVLKNYPSARDRMVCYLRQVERNTAEQRPLPAPAHWEVELPSGVRVIEVYGRTVVLPDHPAQYLQLIMEDHTERHRLQMQLVQSEKLAAVGQLAAGIAHELRNPLTTIFNALYDLNEILQPRTRDAAEDIDICMDEIKRVQDIINNLLDFAREGERSAGETSLNDVLDRTIRLVRHDMKSKHIEVHTNLNPAIPHVAINDNAMKQILINLITNAAQAMPAGGSLTVSTCKRPGPVPLSSTAQGGDVVQTIEGSSSLRLADPPRSASPGHTIHPCKVKEHVLFKISDTGSGIPNENLAHVFNPFFTTKEPGSGTGLGLSVVHTLVRDAHGAISVESTPGAGTTFIIELPGVPAES